MMMMSTPISTPPVTPTLTAATAKKPAHIRSGADATPTANVAPPAAADQFTPTEGADAATSSDTPPAKTGFDPIPAAIGVAGAALSAIVLGATAYSDGHKLTGMAKSFLAAGFGALSVFLAPLGGNLVKDLLKKKAETPVAVTTPAVDATATPVTPTATAAVPPAIDPATGLPVSNGAPQPAVA